MAGPRRGPNGGQIYIDGFTGGNLPPKVFHPRSPHQLESHVAGDTIGRASDESRSSPSPARDVLRGQAFFQYNKEALNSRSPLLSRRKRPPYQNRFYRREPHRSDQEAEGFVRVRRRTPRDPRKRVHPGDHARQQSEPADCQPGDRDAADRAPRSARALDYTINANNTLIVRYQNVQVELDKEGVGSFNLASTAYNQNDLGEHTAGHRDSRAESQDASTKRGFSIFARTLPISGDNSVPGADRAWRFHGRRAADRQFGQHDESTRS